jgi:hypothetical protein
MCNNTLWDLKRLQWYYNKRKETKIDGNISARESNQQRLVKCSE